MDYKWIYDIKQTCHMSPFHNGTSSLYNITFFQQQTCQNPIKHEQFGSSATRKKKQQIEKIEVAHEIVMESHGLGQKHHQLQRKSCLDVWGGIPTRNYPPKNIKNCW